MAYKRAILSTIFTVLAFCIQAQEKIMTVHLNDGTTHQYHFAEVDSVSFAELAEVLPNIEGGVELMKPEMLDKEQCSSYYSLTDHYLHAKNKDIYESVFGSSVAGEYALMPLDKEKMIMLYGGGKYLVTKYGSNHAEALYDENLNVVCAWSIPRNNATYEKNVMKYVIDLTDKEGVYYLRRFVRLAYADRSSIVTMEEFSPKGRTSDIELLGTEISRFTKSEDGAIIPIKKTYCRISFDFVIDENVNIDAEPLHIAKVNMVGSSQNVSILRRQVQPMKVRYYSDDNSIEMADAQEPAFKSGFILGTDTIVRSADFYKPLCGESCLMIWLKGEEYEEEPTREILEAHEASLMKYINYFISLENNCLTLYDGENVVAQVILSAGMTVKQMCEAINANPAFDDFMIHPLIDETTSVSSLVQFPKIHLVGKYHQGYDVQLFEHINNFNYHYDSFPVVLRFAIDTSTHTFDAVATDKGVFVGIDGNFSLFDYDIIRNITISDDISVSNVDVLDGTTGLCLEKFTGTTRLSVPNVITPRSPYLLGLMGHHVEPNSKEGNVSYPPSDVSSERLANMCKIMNEEEYITMNYDELIKYLDSGMQGVGLYTFFIFDDFRIQAVYLEENTRAIFENNNMVANFAIVHGYLWDNAVNSSYKKYIQPMKDMGWTCASHSLRHNQPTAKKPSVYFNYELQQMRKECEDWGMNSEIFVYNWDGEWIPTDVLLQKNGIRYAINSRGKYTTKSTNPYRLGRASFQEQLDFNQVKKILKW